VAKKYKARRKKSKREQYLTDDDGEKIRSINDSRFGGHSGVTGEMLGMDYNMDGDFKDDEMEDWS